MAATISNELGIDSTPTSTRRSLFLPLLSADLSDLEEWIVYYQPVGPDENTIVRDMARQASDMEKWRIIRDAVQRQSFQQLSSLEVVAGHAEFDTDQGLAMACSSEASNSAERYQLSHTRNFYRALHQLETLQAKRKGGVSASSPPVLFRSETDCEAYLIRRFTNERYFCRQCGHTRGYIIASRKVWQCGQCQRQTGFRSGTVLSGSQIPLLVWFETISWILFRPTIDTAELADRIGIRRLGTVRSLANRVRQALASDNPSDQLAGLDRHFARYSRLTQVHTSAESPSSPLARSIGDRMN